MRNRAFSDTAVFVASMLSGLLLLPPPVLAQSVTPAVPPNPQGREAPRLENDALDIRNLDVPPYPETPDATRPTLKGLAHDVLRDQRFLWSRPFRLKRPDLLWTAALLGTAAGLIATDRRAGQEISETSPGDPFRFGRRVSQLGGGAGDLSVASAFYVVGRLTGDDRARTTGVLGLRALADALIVVESLKTVTQRPRPTRDDGLVRNHNADGEFFTGGRSFPSGHATEGWALATVVACQYSHRRWVPPLAYGLAGLVSVGRVLQRQHFPGDTFVGGSIGFMIGRHVCHAASPGSASSTSLPSHQWQLSGSALGTGGAAVTLTRVF